MAKFQSVCLIVILFLAGCAKAQPLQPLVVTALPAEPSSTETSIPLTQTATNTPPTLTSIPPTDTSTPALTQDVAVFGSISTDQVQAGALELVVNAIFKKTLDGLVTAGSIQDYQIMSVSVFPGSNGLITEIIFNVKTEDAAWLDYSGTQATDGWINGDCSRFDFVTTDTEYQLKNRRLCG